jgi:hypothetical protein
MLDIASTKLARSQAPPSVARARGVWPHSAADAAGLGKALRQTAEERCRGDLRSGHQGQHAIRRDQDP